MKKTKRGIRYRMAVCGNTIHSKISQINLKVIKEGKERLGPEEEQKEVEKEKEGKKKEKVKKKKKEKEAEEVKKEEKE